MISFSGIFNMALPPAFGLWANKPYHSWQSFSSSHPLVGNHQLIEILYPDQHGLHGCLIFFIRDYP